MRIAGRMLGLVPKPEEEVYVCWMCGMEHRNPTAYLWHIHACGLEFGISQLAAREIAVLTSKITG